MDIIELSSHPVIFSHSNPASLVNHPRNIKDDQIVACANRGGVIGINGIGIFLGNNNTTTQRIVEHIDYVAQLVGTAHVGIGMDCVFNQDEIKNIAAKNPETFPSSLGFSDVQIAEPEQFSEIGENLTKRGYSDKDIDLILGENFLRIAKNVWR
jgi:membrane dipeptidase